MPSITNFISSFNKDVARPKHFDVTIPAPVALIPYLATARNLSLRCESTQLPSRTFALAEQKFGANPVEKHATHSNYNELEMTFIVSGDMSEKIFFDAWMEYINPTVSFDFNYKEDYISTLTVNQYGMSNDLTYSLNLIDAFPISVNQLDLDWSNDGHHKLTVVFAYRYWQNNSIQQLGSSLLQAGISNILDTFGGLNPDPQPTDSPDFTTSIYGGKPNTNVNVPDVNPQARH
jgi:hypothetical protein